MFIICCMPLVFYMVQRVYTDMMMMPKKWLTMNSTSTKHTKRPVLDGPSALCNYPKCESMWMMDINFKSPLWVLLHFTDVWRWCDFLVQILLTKKEMKVWLRKFWTRCHKLMENHWDRCPGNDNQGQNCY